MISHLFSHHLHAGYTVRRKVWLSALLTAVLVGVYLSLANMLVRVSVPDAIAVAATTRDTATPTPLSATSAAPTTTATSAGTTTSVQACTPTTASNLTSIELSSAPAGLTNRVDPIAQYRIYGTTAELLRNQIRNCAPGNGGNGTAEYTATTAYTMSWQYDTIVSDGACRITNVKVGVHIRTTLPMWEPTSAASAGLAGKWQSFMNALSAHEAGHAALDTQYATKLTADLNAIPVMDCDDLSDAVRSTASADIGALNQANDNYDASTDHGATQGAILPR